MKLMRKFLLAFSFCACVLAASCSHSSSSSKKYYVTVASGISNGKINVSCSMAKAGSIVRINHHADEGYKLRDGSLYYMCNGLKVQISKSAFTMPAGDIVIHGRFDNDYSLSISMDHSVVSFAGRMTVKYTYFFGPECEEPPNIVWNIEEKSVVMFEDDPAMSFDYEGKLNALKENRASADARIDRWEGSFTLIADEENFKSTNVTMKTSNEQAFANLNVTVLQGKFIIEKNIDESGNKIPAAITGIEDDLDEDINLVKRYVDTSGTFLIPDFVDGWQVNGIGAEAFAKFYRSQTDGEAREATRIVRKIILPDSLVDIGANILDPFLHRGEVDGSVQVVEPFIIETFAKTPANIVGDVFNLVDLYNEEREIYEIEPLQYAKILVHADAETYRGAWPLYKDFIIGADEHQITVVVNKWHNHGYARLDRCTAKIGDIVQITGYPDDGYIMDCWNKETKIKFFGGRTAREARDGASAYAEGVPDADFLYLSDEVKFSGSSFRVPNLESRFGSDFVVAVLISFVEVPDHYTVMCTQEDRYSYGFNKPIGWENWYDPVSDAWTSNAPEYAPRGKITPDWFQWGGKIDGVEKTPLNNNHAFIKHEARFADFPNTGTSDDNKPFWIRFDTVQSYHVEAVYWIAEKDYISYFSNVHRNGCDEEFKDGDKFYPRLPMCVDGALYYTDPKTDAGKSPDVPSISDYNDVGIFHQCSKEDEYSDEWLVDAKASDNPIILPFAAPNKTVIYFHDSFNGQKTSLGEETEIVVVPSASRDFYASTQDRRTGKFLFKVEIESRYGLDSDDDNILCDASKENGITVRESDRHRTGITLGFDPNFPSRNDKAEPYSKSKIDIRIMNNIAKQGYTIDIGDYAKGYERDFKGFSFKTALFSSSQDLSETDADVYLKDGTFKLNFGDEQLRSVTEPKKDGDEQHCYAYYVSKLKDPDYDLKIMLGGELGRYATKNKPLKPSLIDRYKYQNFKSQKDNIYYIRHSDLVFDEPVPFHKIYPAKEDGSIDTDKYVSIDYSEGNDKYYRNSVEEGKHYLPIRQGYVFKGLFSKRLVGSDQSFESGQDAVTIGAANIAGHGYDSAGRIFLNEKFSSVAPTDDKVVPSVWLADSKATGYSGKVYEMYALWEEVVPLENKENTSPLLRLVDDIEDTVRDIKDAPGYFRIYNANELMWYMSRYTIFNNDVLNGREGGLAGYNFRNSPVYIERDIKMNIDGGKVNYFDIFPDVYQQVDMRADFHGYSWEDRNKDVGEKTPHKIKRLYIDVTSLTTVGSITYVGLIPRKLGGRIDYLTIDKDSTISVSIDDKTKKATYVGAFAGFYEFEGCEPCFLVNHATIKAKAQYVGGVFGEVSFQTGLGENKFSACENYGNVIAVPSEMASPLNGGGSTFCLGGVAGQVRVESSNKDIKFDLFCNDGDLHFSPDYTAITDNSSLQQAVNGVNGLNSFANKTTSSAGGIFGQMSLSNASCNLTLSRMVNRGSIPPAWATTESSTSASLHFRSGLVGRCYASHLGSNRAHVITMTLNNLFNSVDVPSIAYEDYKSGMPLGNIGGNIKATWAKGLIDGSGSSSIQYAWKQDGDATFSMVPEGFPIIKPTDTSVIPGKNNNFMNYLYDNLGIFGQASCAGGLIYVDMGRSSLKLNEPDYLVNFGRVFTLPIYTTLYNSASLVGMSTDTNNPDIVHGVPEHIFCIECPDHVGHHPVSLGSTAMARAFGNISASLQQIPADGNETTSQFKYYCKRIGVTDTTFSDSAVPMDDGKNCYTVGCGYEYNATNLREGNNYKWCAARQEDGKYGTFPSELARIWNGRGWEEDAALMEKNFIALFDYSYYGTSKDTFLRIEKTQGIIKNWLNVYMQNSSIEPSMVKKFGRHWND